MFGGSEAKCFGCTVCKRHKYIRTDVKETVMRKEQLLNYTLPEVLYHGTSYEAAEAILQSGYIWPPYEIKEGVKKCSWFGPFPVACEFGLVVFEVNLFGWDIVKAGKYPAPFFDCGKSFSPVPINRIGKIYVLTNTPGSESLVPSATWESMYGIGE